MIPHDEPELIAGTFTVMLVPTERLLADPAFLRSPDDDEEPLSPKTSKLPTVSNAVTLPPLKGQRS
jgi:hypothetical protein